MSENQNTSVAVPQQLGIVATKRVDLNRIYAQMNAMQANNVGGKSGGGYSMQGKTKIELQKNGMLTFTNPFTGKPDGAKQLGVLIIDAKFQLQRWLNEGERLDGYDPEKNKGPVCRSVTYTDPVPNEDGSTRIDETGWFYAPAYSAFHAVKMLPDLTGSAGHDGKQGMTLCSTCPLSKQGLKGKDAPCKPAGMMEVVIFRVGDEDLPEPVYGVIKLAPTSIITYGDFLENLKKVHGIGLPQAVLTVIEANKVVKDGKTFAKLTFHAVGKSNAQYVQRAEEAIAKTEAIMAAAKEVDNEGGTAFSGGNNPALPF